MDKEYYTKQEVVNMIEKKIWKLYTIPALNQRIRKWLIKWKIKNWFWQPKRIVKHDELINFINERTGDNY